MTNANKITLAAIIVSVVFVFSSLGPADELSSGGAPAARTGSPCDGFDCTSCHPGTAGSVSGIIASDIPAGGYVPGNVYTITASISDPQKNQFGFEISPQKASGAQVGSLSVTDAVRTQLVGSGKYITHNAAGINGTNNSNSWSFQWTAPAAGTGALTFYGAFLVSNANGAVSGDGVILSSLAVSEDPNASVSEGKINSFRIYPNPAKNFISCTIEPDSKTDVTICSLKGAVLKQLSFSSGSEIRFDVSDLSTGLYNVQIKKSDKLYTSKFVKE